EEPRTERLCASTQLVAVGRRPCAEPLGNTCAPGLCRWWRSPQLTTAPFHRQFREADRHRRLLWEDRELIGEADGIGPHSTPQALAWDRERQNALQLHYPNVRVV